MWMWHMGREEEGKRGRRGKRRGGGERGNEGELMMGLCDLGGFFLPNHFHVSMISRLGRKVMSVCVYNWE